MRDDNSECVPYLVALGNITKLVNFYASHNRLQDAMLVSQVACEGGMTNSHAYSESSRPSRHVPTEDHNGVDELSADNLR